MKKTLVISILLSVLFYFSYKDLNPSSRVSEQTYKSRVSIMTYNVENLFDTEDDPGKSDETFLPLKKKNKKIQEKCKKQSKGHWVKECLNTDWTDFKLKMKMKRLSEVIKSYGKGGPDILILQEIENIRVLENFNDNYLGYPTLLFKEGPDKRGIDVAILSKLESHEEPKLHLQEFKAQKDFSQKKIKPTRGILEAFLVLPNADLLSVFALHFPSQGSPTEARIQAVNRLNELVQKSSDLSIAGGDFNITKSEEKKHQIFSKELSKYWFASHLIGCRECKGTHYYHRKRSWSFLDALLFSKSFDSSKWKIDIESIDVFNELSVQNNRYGSPARFNMGKDSFGVSDHWPVVAEIFLNK